MSSGASVPSGSATAHRSRVGIAAACPRSWRKRSIGSS
eukprot:CAMPEP_0185198348 /NCGR_PEP_ID=MMETSP1140-20130426/42667_1 /TAXON_ID=298111 /ORGANISM="Pavlova sp., Strain CCMP459" /LENGTH=37 /DNA_ID= /DNA_START= /DNA_END= /DNA_ORIENTATION=